jgi:PadR family transcriptional regulator, regulatory protein AphA
MRLNQSGYAILGILTFHTRQTGYDIRKTVETTVRYFWSESYGQIYPTLKRLADEGLIERSGPAGKKGAQEYSITEAGRAALEAWLALPYREDPQRSEFLLKIFFGVQAAPEVTIHHLLTYQQRTRQLLGLLLEIEKLAAVHNRGEPGYPYWRLTLEFGVAQLRAALEWSEHALERLNQSQRKPASS